MTNLKRIRQQRGFSLLESLFAMVVLSIAMLSIARMHALVTQDGGFSKARAIAVNLAQEKADDLRGFTSIYTNCSTAGVFCFTEIGNNTGGREDASSNLLIGSGSVPVGNTTYTRSWTLTPNATYTNLGNYYRCGTAVPSTTNCASPYTKSYPDFKVVLVTVSWADEQGNARSVALVVTIHSSSVTAEANVLGAPYAGAGPLVSAHPDPTNNPIEIGGGKSTETSKPLPEVSGGDSRRVTLPAIVYTGASGNETLVSQEEFVTVNCTCTLQASGTAWTPHRTVWNGSSLQQEYGTKVTKQVGVPSDLSMAGTTNQDELCFQCCRDHHDTNADADANTSGTQLYPSYRPYVDVTTQFDATTGDHKHYKTDGSVAAVGENYVEACRLKRIDGFWRVVQDWMLIDLSVYGCDYFASSGTYLCPVTSGLSSTKQDTYKTWIKNVLKQFVHYMDNNKTINTATTTLPMYDYTSVSPLLNPASSSDDIYVNQGANKQLIARALYADVIFKRAYTGQARKLDEDYVAAVLPVYSTSDFEKLQYIPFYDANMTLLGKWSPTSTNSGGVVTYGDCSPATPTYNETPSPSSAVCVTSEPIDTINDTSLNYYNDFYSRGKIFAKTTGSTLITARIARGNNGLTSSPSINGATDVVIPRQVKAVVPSGTAALSGKVWRGNSGATLNYVTFAASPASGVTCVFTSPATLTTASAADYTCTVPSGWVGTLTFGDSDPLATYNYTPAGTTASITAPATVPDVFVYGPTASIRGRITAIDVVGGAYGSARTDFVNTTVSFSGTVGGLLSPASAGTCSKYNPVITNPGSRTTQWDYSCTVPVGWTGAVTVDIDESALSNTLGHLYWSPSYAEATVSDCYGVSGSCTLQTIPPMLGDVDGIVAGALLTTRQKTNVQAGR